MNDPDATNLNFQLPHYNLPTDLAEKIVQEFRKQREKKGITSEDISAYFNGIPNLKLENIVRGSITKVLMQEELSAYDETECFNPENEKNIMINILSFF